MSKHVFLDMDGCVTESRKTISSHMKKKLTPMNPVIISGASVKQMEKQLDGMPCVKMGQNGNDTPDWYNKLTHKEIIEIYKHIQRIEKFLNASLIGDDTYENRGCQISLSFTGHNANKEWKEKFDPKKEFRKWVLEKVPFKAPGLMVRIAGTTCLDYNRKGNLKGDNLKRYMKRHNLDPKDCIYYGDNLAKGGNDESVIGVMKCVEVKDPEDLYKKL